ncbi:MAG: hypothetical protein ACRET2_03105 [Steroidobacteraceae bacterium]
MSSHPSTKAERQRLVRALREAQRHLRPLEHRLTHACQAFELSGGRDKAPILHALARLEHEFKQQSNHVHGSPVSSPAVERARLLATNSLHLFARGVSDLEMAWRASDPAAARHLATQAANHAKRAQRLQRRASHILRFSWHP